MTRWRNRNDDNLIFAHPDRGCGYFGSCLNCPFKICFEDLTHTQIIEMSRLKTLEKKKEFLLGG